MSHSTSGEKAYFDLHTEGYGRLQRVREVPVRGGRRAQPFLACTIAALVGSAQEPTTRYFDVKVTGAEAKKLVEHYVGIDDPKQRPIIKFRLGDLWSDAFIRPSGERKGEPAASLKGRLLKAELIDPAALQIIEQYELVTRGIGYLNRPKDVTPKKGDPFLACTIGALAGPVEEPEYRYINTIVTTPEAQHLVRRCVQAVEAERKVLVAFRLNDMKADPYLRTKGEHAGEPAASLESKLIHIGLIKIDGQLVYPTANQAPSSEHATAVSTASESSDNSVDMPSTTPGTTEPEAQSSVEEEPALVTSR